DLVARALLNPGVSDVGGAFQLELADPYLIVLEREVGELRRELRDPSHWLTLAGLGQYQIFELAVQVRPDLVARIECDVQGRAHPTPVESDRSIRRQIEPGEREIQPLHRHRRLEVNRVESELLDLDQVRRSGGYRAGDDGAVVPQGRDVVRLDLDVVGRPRSMLGQRAVLERDPSIDQREPIDGDVEPLLRRLRALNQIGEVEVLLAPYDPKGGLAQDQLADPDVAAHERKHVESGIEQLAVRERRAAVGLRGAEPVGRWAPPPQPRAPP